MKVDKKYSNDGTLSYCVVAVTYEGKRYAKNIIHLSDEITNSVIDSFKDYIKDK